MARQERSAGFVIFRCPPLSSHEYLLLDYGRHWDFAKGHVEEGEDDLAAATLGWQHRFGFDLPWYSQYWHWLHGILFGQTPDARTSPPVLCAAPCFGYSFQQNTSVGTLIWQALPVSLSLAAGAATLWLLGGVLIGTLSGLRPGSIIDRVGMTLALVIYLCALPGVGRKTAACVLLFALGLRDVPVDTHVGRVGARLGLLRPGAASEERHDAMVALTPRGAELEAQIALVARFGEHWYRELGTAAAPGHRRRPVRLWPVCDQHLASPG